MKLYSLIFGLFSFYNIANGFSVKPKKLKRCLISKKNRKLSEKYFPDRCSNTFCSSVNEFTLDVMKDFAKDQDNFVISPFSISSAFAMLYIGAGGNTKAEMSSAFKWTDFKNESLARAAKDLLSTISRESPNITTILLSWKQKVLTIANNVWVDETIGIRDSYKQTINDYFNVKPRVVPFVKKSDKIRQQINNWVQRKTDNKVKDLFPPEAISSYTRMVLANAIHFKGVWSTPFNKMNTFTGEFYPNGRTGNPMGIIANVQYMYGRRMPLWAFHDKCEKVKLVGLPYEDDFMMLIVMPLKSSIDDTISRVTTQVFNRWIAKLKLKKLPTKKLELQLPKFTIENSINLVEYLKEKQMSDLFSQGHANLSAISKVNKLYVSAAVHKSFISVDEEGTTASGATGIGIDTYSVKRKIKINRPFLFYIVCRKTNTIIFTGKVTYPNENL